MKKQCLSHVRELVKNPAKILTGPCVFSHDCKEQDGDGGDAAAAAEEEERRRRRARRARQRGCQLRAASQDGV